MSAAPGPASAEAAWRAAVERGLKGRAFDEAMVFHGLGGVAIQPLYAPDRQPALPRAGKAPAIFQRVDHPDPIEANRLARLDIEDGAAGLVLCFSGSPGARGFGLPAEADALAAAVCDIPLGSLPLRLELPPFAGPDLALALLRQAEAAGIETARLDLDVGLDPIGNRAWSGEASRGRPDRADHLAATVRTLRPKGLRGPLLRADGRLVHEAGGTEAQELATVLATAVAYLRALEAGGIGLEAARDSVSFTLAADADVLLTLAKCRALRLLWGGIEAACALPPAPLPLHVETSWRCLTRRGAATNIIRCTLGCAAALLGGADSVTVLPFTSALGLPDAAARRLARNTPLILLQEAHLGRVADPGAGAGAVAGLTEALVAQAWALFQRIEAEGGLPGALASGWWQEEVGHARLRRQQAVATKQQPLVGATVFVNPDDAPPAVLRPAVEPRAARNGSAASRVSPLPSIRDEDFSETTP